MENEKDNFSVVKADNNTNLKQADRSVQDYDKKFIDALDRISSNARSNNRFRIVLLIIIAIALFSFLFMIGFITFALLGSGAEEEPPLAAMEIRALNRIETLFVEIPVTYRMEDSNVTEIIATTGYGVFTVDLDQAIIDETDKRIDITLAPPELSTVDIYANQNQVIYRGEGTGIFNEIKQVFKGDAYSDGFTFVSERNVALKEDLRSMLESEEYDFLRRQAETQAISIISNFVHSIDAYPIKRDVRIHFE